MDTQDKLCYKSQLCEIPADGLVGADGPGPLTTPLFLFPQGGGAGLRKADRWSFSTSVPLGPWFSNFSLHQNHLEGSIEPGCRASPTAFHSVGLGLGLRICILNKFSGNADTAGPGGLN